MSKFVELCSKMHTFEVAHFNLSINESETEKIIFIYTGNLKPRQIKRQKIRLLYLAPHGALKYVGVNFDPRVGLIRAHFGLLEVAQENCLEHRAARTENQLVALEVLQKKKTLTI
jgi:hypothetical protein